MQLINEQRLACGVRLLALAQCWGDMPMEMWNRYLHLKKSHLPSMADILEALQITHSMTPFYDFRMLDLTESTRPRSQSTLVRSSVQAHSCVRNRTHESQGLSCPARVAASFVPLGKMRVLSALRKMILKA